MFIFCPGEAIPSLPLRVTTGRQPTLHHKAKVNEIRHVLLSFQTMGAPLQSLHSLANQWLHLRMMCSQTSNMHAHQSLRAKFFSPRIEDLIASDDPFECASGADYVMHPLLIAMQTTMCAFLLRCLIMGEPSMESMFNAL
jgi:hypothetical protein